MMKVAHITTNLSTGNVYDTIYGDWTSDGGHLNGTGRVWVAKGWYALAASQV